MKNWLRVQMSTWKAQVCLEESLPALVSEVQWFNLDPKVELATADPVQELYLDLPGMVYAKRTWQFLTVNGLTLAVPTTDFGYFLKALKNSTVSGVGYHRLEGWMACLLLTPGDRDQLLAAMEARAPAIEAQAREEEEAFTQAVKTINRDKINIISPRDPQSLEGALVSRPNKERN